MSTKIHNFDVYTIESLDGKTRASFVPEKGGVGASIIMPFVGKDREILFQHKNFWQSNDNDLLGGFPFIFPICARIERNNIAGNYLYDGKIYNLPIHGFAPYMPWEVEQKSSDSLVLSLYDTPKTLAQYPFNFQVELQYRVTDKTLICEQYYMNRGEKPMPYYAGFHPYFLTPEFNRGKEKVFFNYHPKRRFRYNEKLTDIIGEQDLFNLPASINDPSINEQLVELESNKIVELIYPDGFKINMEVKGQNDLEMFNYVQLYTIPDKPFVCLEPWMSFPNAMNTVAGVRWLQPGQSERGVLKLWVYA